MVRLNVSSEAADPSLSRGWSYFVENQAYTEHLAKYGAQVDVVRKFIAFSKIIKLICDLDSALHVLSTMLLKMLTKAGRKIFQYPVSALSTVSVII